MRSPPRSSATTPTTPRATPPSCASPTCLAHYSQGSPVSSTELLRAARTVGFGPGELRSVLNDLPYPSQDRPRAVEPCPLSTRELDVLKRLAQGMVYKQIALELSLSTSTVRTHLHNIYGKLGAVDRAQAVLHATERGWLYSTLSILPRPADGGRRYPPLASRRTVFFFRSILTPSCCRTRSFSVAGASATSSSSSSRASSVSGLWASIF